MLHANLRGIGKKTDTLRGGKKPLEYSKKVHKGLAEGKMIQIKEDQT